jgi:hypothetical protein
LGKVEENKKLKIKFLKIIKSEKKPARSAR